MSDADHGLTQIATARAERLRWRGVTLMCCGLGLAAACLNPAISDEPPVSETTLVLDSPDAGAPVVEAPDESPPEPSMPTRPGGDERTRDGEVRTRNVRSR
jgi:hypothetical protein